MAGKKRHFIIFEKYLIFRYTYNTHAIGLLIEVQYSRLYHGMCFFFCRETGVTGGVCRAPQAPRTLCRGEKKRRKSTAVVRV